MPNMKKINTNRNKMSEYIYLLYDNGLMQEYSENHFLIRAMKGDVDIIKEYGHLLSGSFINNFMPDFSSTFLINFSIFHKVVFELQVFHFPPPVPKPEL